MELSVQLEKPSNIVRKLTVKVPATEVSKRFERGLAEVQRTARLKGFRPGHAPISVVKQFYGDDVKHRVFHNVIEESYQQAIRDQKLQAVGSPKIETPDHKTGEGAHDHGFKEGQDLTYTATIEVLPEIDVKSYTGLALSQEKHELKEQDIEIVIKNLLDSRAELIPASGGLANADGTMGSRPIAKGDFVDMTFAGGLVTGETIKELPGMKGTRLHEMGSDSLIPGFEEEMMGMRRGETKTFRIPFPKDYHEKELAGQNSEFTVTVNEVKEKKLPALDDEFAKEMGYDSVADLRKKAEDHLTKEKADESQRKLRNDAVQMIVEKNPFDVPQALIESQTRSLAQEWAQELKRQGVDEATIQQAILSELEGLKKRAESQVRASLLLEAIAKKENIEVKPTEYDDELEKSSKSMKVEIQKLREYYDKEPGRKEDFLFRLRQERTLEFLIDKAKVKTTK
jgi:trigger factor